MYCTIKYTVHMSQDTILSRKIKSEQGKYVNTMP